MKQIAAAVAALGLPASVLSPLQAYVRLVEREADRLGLMSEAGLADLDAFHLPGSLAFASAVEPVEGAQWVDVGSGAGLPGIPLAIAYPATRFVLVEPQRRRAGFLELVAEDLGLRNVEVAVTRLQDLTGLSDVAVAKAFSSREASGGSGETLALLAGHVRQGGTVSVQVAKDVTIPAGAELATTELSAVDSEFHFLIMRP